RTNAADAYREQYDAERAWARRTRDDFTIFLSLRFHISIEGDRDRLPSLPPPASSVARRFEAAAALRGAGLRVVITVATLLPIAEPRAFFERVAEVADAVVVDHYIGGDGSHGGARTLATPLPRAMACLDPASVGLDYRDRMVALAE